MLRHGHADASWHDPDRRPRSRADPISSGTPAWAPYGFEMTGRSRVAAFRLKLTPRQRELLLIHLWVNADNTYDDIDEHGDQPVDSTSDWWAILDRLPEATWELPVWWRRQQARAFDDLALTSKQAGCPIRVARQKKLHWSSVPPTPRRRSWTVSTTTKWPHCPLCPLTGTGWQPSTHSWATGTSTGTSHPGTRLSGSETHPHPAHGSNRSQTSIRDRLTVDSADDCANSCAGKCRYVERQSSDKHDHVPRTPAHLAATRQQRKSDHVKG